MSVALEFIRQYRALEKASLSKGYELIETCLAPNDKGLYNHLCGHWRGKKKAFGAFFVNLSSRSQIKILHHWGIIDPDDHNYLLVDEHMNTEQYLFGESPKTREMLHYLLVFFLNHGISEQPAEGIELEAVPTKKTFGNSANWGEYVLRHTNPEKVLAIILSHVQATKPKRAVVKLIKQND